MKGNRMFVINKNKKETRKRGCFYCADLVAEYVPKRKSHTRICPHDECPYHELDDFESFEQYVKAQGKTSITELLKALCVNRTL